MIKNLEELKKLIQEQECFLLLLQTTWCPMCRIMENTLSEFSEIHNIPLYQVNIEEAKDIRRYFKIDAAPNLYIYKNHQIFSSIIGNHDLEEIEKLYSGAEEN